MKMNLKSMTALGIMVAGMLSSCNKSSQMQMPSANFETMSVKAQDVTMTDKYTATIRGRQDIDIMPQVGGTLWKLCVTEGESVKAGQTLFIIDQVPYKAALNTAEAALNAAKAQQATAQLNYDSRKTLFDQKIISDIDLQTAYNSLQTAKAQVAQCEAQVVNAKNNLSYTVVKSPSNGVVGTLPYRQGALVGPSMQQALTTVSDNSQMYVYFSITEAKLLEMAREYGSIETAIDTMPDVKLTLVDGSEYTYPGRVESISGVVDRSTGTVQLRAVFDNRDKLLHSGSTGAVVIPSVYKNRIVIPTTATVQMQDKYKVYTVDKDNIAHEQLVTIEQQSDGKSYIIKEGLKEGDVVVAVGAGMVRDGQNVKPNKE